MEVEILLKVTIYTTTFVTLSILLHNHLSIFQQPDQGTELQPKGPDELALYLTVS